MLPATSAPVPAPAPAAAPAAARLSPPPALPSRLPRAWACAMAVAVACMCVCARGASTTTTSSSSSTNTVIEFSRPFSTCDTTNDRIIAPGITNLIYAYNDQVPTSTSTIMQHLNSWSTTVTLREAGATTSSCISKPPYANEVRSPTVSDMVTYLEATYSSKQTLENNFVLYWNANETTQRLDMAVDAPTTGWVGVGFSASGLMPGSDIIIGWLSSSGTASINDYHATGHVIPPVDPIQNIYVTAVTHYDANTYAPSSAPTQSITETAQPTSAYQASSANTFAPTESIEYTVAPTAVVSSSPSPDISKGYSSELSVAKGWVMYYSVNKTHFSVKMSYDGSVWIAWAINTSPAMVGGDAVICLPDGTTDAVAFWYLGGHSSSQVTILATQYQSLGEASVTQTNGVTVCTFTRTLTASSPQGHSINTTGSNYFLFSHGSQNSGPSPGHPTSTGGYYIYDVDLSSNSATSVSATRNIVKIHAYLMFTALGVIMYAGAYSMRIFKDSGSTWGGWFFYLHVCFQMIGAAITVAGFVAGIKAVPSGVAQFSKRHHVVGLVVTILVLVQTSIAIVRPHAPAKDLETQGQLARKTVKRRIWEVLHRLTALVILVLAIINMRLSKSLSQSTIPTKTIDTFVTISSILLVVYVFWSIVSAVAHFCGLCGSLARSKPPGATGMFSNSDGSLVESKAGV